jgi:hypothetical protein
MCKIINKAIYLKHQDDKIDTYSSKKLHDAFCHMTYESDKSFINAWTNKNPKIRAYDDMNVYPKPLICPHNHFNLWIPFKHETNTTPYTPNKEGLEFILKHFEYMCDHNKEHQQYVISWMAQMIQYPAIKSVCLTFVGKQGSGKSTFIRVLESLLGKHKVFESTDPTRDVWGDFYKQMVNAFLVSIPELSKKDYLQGEAKFKGLITDPTTININGKGENQYYEINSYHRVVTTSNHDDPVKTSEDDRRNVIFRVSDELIGNKEYFNKLYNYINNENVMRTLYDYLMTVPNMDSFHKIPLPVTEHQKQLRKLDMSIPEQFICSMVENSNAIELAFAADELFNKFIEWKQENHVEYETSKNKFGVKLSLLRLNGMTNQHTKKGSVRVFNVKQLKKQFGIQSNFMLVNDVHILDLDDL